MKKLLTMWKDEKGISLIIALGVIALMIIMSTLILMSTRNTDITVASDSVKTQATNVAEAGIDNAIATAIANFNNYFPGGVAPNPTSGDGEAIYTSPQQMTDQSGHVTGTYQVWARQDPNNQNMILLTAQGTANPGATPVMETVRVSVKFTEGAFDYAFLAGSQTNPATTTLTANLGGDDDSAGANIRFTGKFNVNGNLTISGQVNGNEDDHEGQRGTVAFETRPGYINPPDPVTYTGTYTMGNQPSGTQPSFLSSYVQFPTVDFTRFQSQSSGGGIADNQVITINMPSSGAPAGGWTRVNSNTMTIDADTFQNTYKNYQVVTLTSSVPSMTVQIIGGCTSTTITPTIVMTKDPSSGKTISELDFVGPNLSLQPTNGVAFLSSGGKVQFENEVTIGSQTAGALVYLNGQDAPSSLSATQNLIMYGSLVVNGPVTFTAQGKGEEDDQDDNHQQDTHHCGGGNDDQHSDEGHTMNMAVTYGSEFLTNPNLPSNWWSWTGGSGVTALKYNYQRG